jgi:hypothetical protein
MGPGRPHAREGRRELERFAGWDDERPEAERHFKLYGQATDKSSGISDETAAALEEFYY